ncbi:hypothetical protein [Psychrobacter fjordensis]|uniref:hypothetical protein n=1 Tax=Psychrobacter fjordensis TaxID=664424 RepID=UPI00191971BF|nr:hypothetical protein [Psychrobacter fjordensis]
MGSGIDKNDNERSLNNDNDIAPATRLPEDEVATTTRITEKSDVEQAEKSIEQNYVPRSTVRKLLPIAIMLGLMLLEFIFCYKIAEDGGNLLSMQFLLGVPLFIGATTVYLASYRKPITTGRVFLLTFWLIVGILIISVPILKEGTICIVMASPVIYVALLLGGLSMRLVCLKVWKSKALYSVALLPLLVLFAPLEPMPETYQVTDTILINATPKQVWQTINNIDNIEPAGFYQESQLLPFMQVPTPKSAITIWENNQWVRKCEWHGGIKFDEPLISQIPNRQLRWQFVFYPNSVPPKTLDDHVTINGEHFKLLHGQYDLEPVNNNMTRLTFNVTYRISTNMNFYAGFWGKWVMDEFVEDTLGLYKNRLESNSKYELI